MEKVTLLTRHLTDRINGKEVLHFPVHGLKVGRTLLKAHGVVNEQDLILNGTPFDLGKFPDDRLRRLVDFYTKTQVEQKVSGYNGHSFVSYVMGWSRAMNEKSVRNTGLPRVGLATRANAGDAYGIVKFNAVHNIRGQHAQSVIGVDGSTNVLTVPERDRDLVIMRIPDAFKVFDGNTLTLLRDPKAK